MPENPAAHEFTTRYPKIRAWQWDGSVDTIQTLFDAGAPISPDPTPDRGWQLECTAQAEFHTELLWTGLWVTHSGLGWDICEPNMFARTFIAREKPRHEGI
ncbi:hypothetical protein ACWELJ_21335 [Nocardia sp. NPDC004582]